MLALSLAGAKALWVGADLGLAPNRASMRNISGKCCPLGRWHHIVGGTLIVDSRNLRMLLRCEDHHGHDGPQRLIARNPLAKLGA